MKSSMFRILKLAFLAAVIAALPLACTVFPDLDSSSVSARSTASWTPGTSYPLGSLVSWNGSTYRCTIPHTALVSWEPGNAPTLWTPDSSALLPPTPAPAPDPVPVPPPAPDPLPPPASSCTIDTWSPSTAYTTGTTIHYGTKHYQARWWTQGNQPDQHSAGLGQDCWKIVADCTTTTPPAPGPNPPPPAESSVVAPTSTWGSRVFAPYAFLSMNSTFSISTAMEQSGQKFYTLSFIIADSKGEPAWEGSQSIESDFYINEINTIRRAGGDVIISFGGLDGYEIAQKTATVDALVAKYQRVIDRYKISWIDMNIENGLAISDQVSIDLRNKALKVLQDKNPGLIVSYCLATLPSGLVLEGKNILANAKSNGVRVDVLTGMAMNYGAWSAPNPDGRMGYYAIEAARSLRDQLVNLGYDQTSVGLCPMIGQNDLQAEVFYLADAKELVNFGLGTPWLRVIAFWSATRDNGSGGRTYPASPRYSGIVQSDWEFTKAFASFR